MNCPQCTTRGNVKESEIRASGWRYRQWICPGCGHRWMQRTTPDDVLPHRGGRVGRLTDAQVEWVLTTPATGQACRLVLQCSETLISKIRRRVIYCHVRPDLPRWRAGAPWLTAAPAPRILQPGRQPRKRFSCLNCEHYGGLNRPCLLGHDAIYAAGFGAAAQCTDYQEADDDDELEAAG